MMKNIIVFVIYFYSLLLIIVDVLGIVCNNATSPNMSPGCMSPISTTFSLPNTKNII